VPRSVKKGPFVDFKLAKKLAALGDNDRTIVKTWARSSVIPPDFVGRTIAVHNGKVHVPVFVTENMVGHKLGEFAPTRKFRAHGGKLASAQRDKSVMPVKATAKGVRISPRKVSPVAALVRGRSVSDALVILDHAPRRSSLAIKKLIESAKANASHNHDLKPATLMIREISVSAGPRLKRIRPAARGAALRYQRVDRSGRRWGCRPIDEYLLRPVARHTERELNDDVLDRCGPAGFAGKPRVALHLI